MSYVPKPLPQSLQQRLQHARLPPIALDLRKPLNTQELAVIAVLLNPELIALRSKERVACAQVFDAGLLPDPKLNLSFDKYLHQTNPPTIPLTNGYAVGVDWDLIALINRQSKIKIAASKYQQIHFDIAWQEWLVANRVQLLATRVFFLQKQEQFIKKALSSSKYLLDLSDKNLKRHDIKIDEFALRKSAYLDLQDQLQTLQGQLKSAQLQLNQNLGMQPNATLKISAVSKLRLPPLQAEALYKKAFYSRYDLIALQAGYESQEGTVHQAILNQFPSFVLGVHRAQDTGAVNTVGVSVNFDIPLFNKNRGVIAVESATRDQLYKEYKARLFKAQAEIAQLVADIKRLEASERVLRNSLSKLRDAVELMFLGLKRGNITETAYQDAKAGLISKEITLLILQQTQAEQMIALQIAIGRPWSEVIRRVKQK